MQRTQHEQAQKNDRTKVKNNSWDSHKSTKIPLPASQK